MGDLGGEVRGSRRAFGAGSGSSAGLRCGWRGPFCGNRARASGSGIVRVACLVRMNMLISGLQKYLGWLSSDEIIGEC